MAFMMPVMKNNYDIYKDTRGRSRKTSECSNASAASNAGTAALSSALGTPAQSAQQQQRRRKVSECKSESFATSPSHGQLGAHRMQMQRCHSSRGFTRNTSRSSHNGSMMQMMSPTRSSPPSRTQTASALERQAAAQAAAQSAAAAAAAQQQRAEQQQSSNDYTKFHVRLVDKLRKSFRKDNGKRS